MASSKGSKPDKKDLFVSMLILQIMSGYFVPRNPEVLLGILNWICYQKELTVPTEGLHKIFLKIISNYKFKYDE